MEYGFYHPERGYWQTISEPTDDQRAAFPEGTIEVPLKPGPHHQWQEGAWVYIAPPVPVIDVATAPSMRLALLQAGRLDDVENAVKDNEAAQIEWEYRQTYRRDSPLIAAMSGPAGFTSEEIDGLFELAAQIEADR